jgi:putative transposase
VHIIVHVDSKEAVGLMMHLVAGVYGQKRNDKEGDEGSVWEHPYQCTIIQDGQHLLNCIRYVSLNMVRAGVVRHPEAWKWCSHDEYIGQRQRYRIINKERLLASLDIEHFADFQRIYDEGITRKLNQGQPAREAQWSEALAVGDRLFVERVARTYERRSNFVYADATASGSADTWTVRESPSPYSADLGLSETAKALTGPPEQPK